MRKFKAFLSDGTKPIFELGDKAGRHEVVNAVLRMNRDGMFLYNRNDVLSIVEIT